MSSTNEEKSQTQSIGSDDMVYVGITRPSILRGEHEHGSDLHYYRKFMPAYRRFVNMLQREEKAYERLSEVEESLDDRLSDLQKTMEWSSYSVFIHNWLLEVIEPVDNVRSLMDDSTFEKSVWEFVTTQASDPTPEKDPPFLELRRGVPRDNGSEFVVHSGQSDWAVSAEIEKLLSGINTRISKASTHRANSIERHKRAQAAFDAVQEALFEYETGTELGRLLEEEERIDRGEDQKKPGPNERISDQQIQNQIEQLADANDIDPESMDPTPLARTLADEFGFLGWRQYFNRIQELPEERE